MKTSVSTSASTSVLTSASTSASTSTSNPLASNPLAPFSLYTEDLKVPIITVYPAAVYFNKKSFTSLDFTPYAKILVDKAGQQIAIAKAEENELGSRKFFEHREGKQICVRFASREIVKLFLDTAGLEAVDKKGVKFSGKLVQDGVVIFDMRTTV